MSRSSYVLFVKLPLVGLPKDLREGDAETLRRGFFRGEALPSKMSARRFLLLGTNILSTKKKETIILRGCRIQDGSVSTHPPRSRKRACERCCLCALLSSTLRGVARMTPGLGGSLTVFMARYKTGSFSAGHSNWAIVQIGGKPNHVSAFQRD